MDRNFPEKNESIKPKVLVAPNYVGACWCDVKWIPPEHYRLLSPRAHCVSSMRHLSYNPAFYAYMKQSFL